MQQEKEAAGSGGDIVARGGERKKKRRRKGQKKSLTAVDGGDHDDENDLDNNNENGGVIERQREHPFIVMESGEVARGKNNGLDYLFHLYEQCREFLIQVQNIAKECGKKCPTKVHNILKRSTDIYYPLIYIYQT